MSTHNIGFYEDLTNIIFELASNTHLIPTLFLLLHLCLQKKKKNFVQTVLYIKRNTKAKRKAL